MRKTLIALLFAAALPTVAMAMPEGQGPMGPMDGPRHGAQMHDHGKGPYSQLDLSREQREQIRKIMGEQMHERPDRVRHDAAEIAGMDVAAGMAAAQVEGDDATRAELDGRRAAGVARAVGEEQHRINLSDGAVDPPATPHLAEMQDKGLR